MVYSFNANNRRQRLACKGGSTTDTSRSRPTAGASQLYRSCLIRDCYRENAKRSFQPVLAGCVHSQYEQHALPRHASDPHALAQCEHIAQPHHASELRALEQCENYFQNLRALNKLTYSDIQNRHLILVFLPQPFFGQPLPAGNLA